MPPTARNHTIVPPATFQDDARFDSYPRALQLSSGDVFVAGDCWCLGEPWPHRLRTRWRHPLQSRSFVATGLSQNPYGWSDRAPLQHPRVWLNGVVLPTGDVLVTGGASAPNQPVYAPELYRIGFDPDADPDATNFSTLMATPPTVAGSGPTESCVVPGPAPRLYHHVAVLLPDGRVFVGGGESRSPLPSSHFTAELFSPPYLFQGDRPVIEDAPAQVPLSAENDARTFAVGATLPIGDSLDRVVLLRPASVTHHFDVDQRYIELDFTVDSYSVPFPQANPPIAGYSLTVEAPDEMLAPPGWYMLFVVSTKGGTGHRVPSVGEFVRFQ